MKAFLLFTSTGPIVIATSHGSVTAPEVLGKLQDKGIDKFMAYEVPFERTRQLYGGHFTIAMQNHYETDELRVIDVNGDRVFGLFRLNELGKPVIHETGAARVFEPA